MVRRVRERRGGQPRGLVLEHSGERAVVAGPRHSRHDHPVHRAPHPRRLGLQEHPGRAEVQATPPPSPVPTVIPRTATPAPPAPRRRPPGRAHRGHHRSRTVLADLQVDGLDHHLLLDAEQHLPYADTRHAMLPAPVPVLRQLGNLTGTWRVVITRR